MTRMWRVGIAAPVGLFAASFVLNLAYTDCGYEGAPPCETNWVYEWKDYTLLLGLLATGLLAFVVTVRALVSKTPVRIRRWAVLGFAIPWAYAAGRMADALLNDESPIHGGGYRFEQGGATEFYAVFGFWLVIALLVVVPGRFWVKALAGLVAFVLTVFVMFW